MTNIRRVTGVHFRVLAFGAAFAAVGGLPLQRARGQGPARDAAVYAAVLDSLRADFGVAFPVVAQALPPTAPERRRAAPGLGARLAREVPGFDTALVEVLWRLPPAERPPRRVLADRRGLRWIDSAQLRAPPRAEPGRPGRAAQAFWLSRVAYAPDGRWAVVYAAYVCNDVCGRGGYVLLARDGAGRWRVRAWAVQYVV
ncbi:hypothetical protein tb265_41410 [Gemmatimonadetes bacterium T265]|nr:hypothetical protein tb265_41410 [Gemmatimonadetes bacterium T265]